MNLNENQKKQTSLFLLPDSRFSGIRLVTVAFGAAGQTARSAAQLPSLTALRIGGAPRRSRMKGLIDLFGDLGQSYWKFKPLSKSVFLFFFVWELELHHKFKCMYCLENVGNFLGCDVMLIVWEANIWVEHIDDGFVSLLVTWSYLFFLKKSIYRLFGPVYLISRLAQQF